MKVSEFWGEFVDLCRNWVFYGKSFVMLATVVGKKDKLRFCIIFLTYQSEKFNWNLFFSFFIFSAICKGKNVFMTFKDSFFLLLFSYRQSFSFYYLVMHILQPKNVIRKGMRNANKLSQRLFSLEDRCWHGFSRLRELQMRAFKWNS